MSTIKQFLLILALVTLAAVFGASLYQSIIEGPNFGAALHGLEEFGGRCPKNSGQRV